MKIRKIKDKRQRAMFRNFFRNDLYKIKISSLQYDYDMIRDAAGKSRKPIRLLKKLQKI